MRDLMVVLTLLVLQASVSAQSIEPVPGVVEQGGVAEIRAWTGAEEPLAGLGIGLRRLHGDGSPDGPVSQRCATDGRGIAMLQVDGAPGRYRLEAEVGGVVVHSPFRVVPAAPRLAWFVAGLLTVSVAAGWLLWRRRPVRTENRLPSA